MAVTLRITTDTKPIDAVRRAVELVDAAFAKAGDTVVAMGVKMDAEHAKIMRHMRDEIAAQQQLNTLRNSGLTSLGSHYAASQQQLQQLIATQNQFNTAMQSGNQQSAQAIQQQIQALQQQLLLMQQIAAQSNQQPAPGKEESSPEQSTGNSKATGAAVVGAKMLSRGKKKEEEPDLFGGLSGEGGKLYKATRFAAEMNILPYGYERYGMRIARTAEMVPGLVQKLAPFHAILGRVAIGLTVVEGGIRGVTSETKRMADEGYAGAKKLDQSFQQWGDTLSRTPGQIKSIGMALLSLPSNIAGNVGTATAHHVRTLIGDQNADAAMGATGSFLSDMNLMVNQKSEETLRKEEEDAKRRRFMARGGVEAARAMDRRKEEERQKAKELARQRDIQELKRREEASFAEIGNLEYQASDKKFAAISGDNLNKDESKWSDEQKRLVAEMSAIAERKKLVTQERDMIVARKNALIEEDRARREEESARAVRSSIQATREHLAVSKEIAKVRSGKDWDARRVIDLASVNKELDRELEKHKQISAQLTYTAEQEAEKNKKLAEHESRISQLMGRREEEMQRQIVLRQRFVDIAAKFSDSGDDITIDNLKAEQTERDKIRKQSADRIAMLRDAGILSDREADEQERILAASKDELKTLERIQQVERERLERQKKRADEQRAAAKDEKQAREAEERQMQAISDAADMAARHARERAAAERNIAEAQRDQEATELRRKQQQEIDNMRKAVEERRKQAEALRGRIDERIDPRRQMLGLLMNRSRAVIAEEEKKRGRKLSAGELQKVMTRERRNLVNQARGPSERQKALELARQRGIQRKQAQEDAKKRSKLPPNLRRMESELRRGDLQRGEEERQKAAQDGRLASGMNADFNRDMAGQRNQLVQQQIDALERSGQIDADMVKTMRNAANALANHERTMAELEQSIAIINQQIESVAESNKRRAAKNQGNGRF